MAYKKMKQLTFTLYILLTVIFSSVEAKAQTVTNQSNDLLSQLQDVEDLQEWMNENLLADLFDSTNPISMMIFTENSVLSFNPDSIVVSMFNPREIGTTRNGKLYHLTDERNPNFMMMVMGAPYEQGAYEKPWYYTRPWVFCSDYNMANKMVPNLKGVNDWYTMLLHECTHVWQQRHPEFLSAISNFAQLYGGPEAVGNLHKQDSTLYANLKAENEAILEAINALDPVKEQEAITLFLKLRENRKNQMIANGYPAELIRFGDMQELAEGQTRWMEYNLGKHLGLYEDNDLRWGDIDKSGWFYVTGYNLYCLLLKRGFNVVDLYQGEIMPFEYYLK